MSSRPRMLIVEDDPDLRRTLVRCMVREGCEVAEARDGVEAIEKLDAGFAAQLVLTDLEMPRASGREVLAAGLKRRIPVVILTGHATVQNAVELMRQGAANFLTKPFSPATLRALLEDAFGRRTAPLPDGPTLLIGGGPRYDELLELIGTVAETDATVLVTGESGTGKEVVARTIHARSRRATGPFVAINCGAIPEALLESELFGHARGAFTGATQARAGRLQLAERGTLFLDEIGDMPLAFQVKLLRVLQERQYEVLGEGTPRSADVRVIAATHRDLPKMAAEGTFREDLFYRLNVIDLKLLPLRERKGDVPLLVDHFLRAANTRHGRQVPSVSAEVVAALSAYDWPGNIRELANVIEKMVVLKKGGELDTADLPPAFAAAAAVTRSDETLPLPADGIDLKKAVTDLELQLIEQAMLRTGGNRNAAAQLLGLKRTTLVEKLKRQK